MEEKKSIFRQQSLDRVSSPEQLNDYIKATNPSVWGILCAVIILLAGACAWGIFGRIETVIMTGAVCTGNEVKLYIGEEYAQRVEKSLPLPVRINDVTYTITYISENPMLLTSEDDPYAIHVGGMSVGDFAYITKFAADLPDETYEAYITLESISPISFITN